MLEYLNNIDIVIYHANCHDGMSAAAIYNHYYPGKKLIPAKHYETPKEILLNKNILFLDFSYPREIMEPLIQENNVFVVDHHVTAMFLKEILPETNYCLDKEYCGAMLLWRIINKDIHPPTILNYVNDRDLWLNQLPDYMYVFDGIVHMKPTVELMQKLIFDTNDISEIISLGKIVNKAKMDNINFIKNKVYIKSYNFNERTYQVAYVNCPIFGSDLGSYIVNNFNVDFAGIFHFNGKKTIFSLRGKGVVNLSLIAKKYGGGGHFDASGCAINGLVNELI